MTAPAAVPGVYVRWCQLDGFDPPMKDIAAMFAVKTSAERYFWESLDEAARALAAQERPAPELADPELTEHVSIRFPADMIAAAKQLAAARHMTVSAWIRREVEREAARREPPAPELPHVDALVAALNKKINEAEAVLRKVRDLAAEHESCIECSLSEELETVLGEVPELAAPEDK